MHQVYEIIGFLGRGGFGAVQHARHRLSGLDRAIKQVACDSVEALFEVEALMDLDHPNVVRMYEYYTGEDVVHIVQEYCSGQTLEKHVRAQPGGRLAPEEAGVVLRQILRALLCCHAHGLAHRDLKPDNFVYGSKDATAPLKLIDFGLSLGPLSLARPPAYVAAAGTLEHTAPETLPTRDEKGRLLRAASYSCASDLWSVGAIFFWLVTGEPLVTLEDTSFDAEGGGMGGPDDSAEFGRLMNAVIDGRERDVFDEVAGKVRSDRFLSRRLALARRRAPEAACDLLEQLLRRDPAERITAAAALKHRFIADSYAHAGRRPSFSAFDEPMLDNMRRFAGYPALRRLAIVVEAHMLTPKDDAAIRRAHHAFRAAEESGEGVLSVDEIGAALASHGHDVPPDLERIWTQIDLDRRGNVNLLEFVAATMEPRITRDARLCKTAFRVLDADQDGYITQADLERILVAAPGGGAEVAASRAKGAAAILASARPDAQGRVSLARFCEVMQDDAGAAAALVDEVFALDKGGAPQKGHHDNERATKET